MRKQYDATSATCLVYTYKEGLLSAVAHDLKIRVGKFTIDIDDEDRIEAIFDARSLRVECAREGERDAPGKLGDRDRGQIERTIVSDVLDANRHPQIRFVSSNVERKDGSANVRGSLTLHGITRELTLTAREKDGEWTMETQLFQPDYGIKPYRAALGTLRIRPEVRIAIRVSARS